ncbi:hypothetical protein F4677DRAFT_426951 [Hypoxylon crocopeplum]|nr:hypothetical protein F4677DRAFT_426951 [Hypoxylon crocopeplum]
MDACWLSRSRPLPPTQMKDRLAMRRPRCRHYVLLSRFAKVEKQEYCTHILYDDTESRSAPSETFWTPSSILLCTMLSCACLSPVEPTDYVVLSDLVLILLIIWISCENNPIIGQSPRAFPKFPNSGQVYLNGQSTRGEYNPLQQASLVGRAGQIINKKGDKKTPPREATDQSPASNGLH